MNAKFYTMEDIADIHQSYMQGKEIELPLPYTVSEDKKKMIVYRYCRADRQENGRLQNVFPNQEGKGENQIGCLIVSEMRDDCSVSCGEPLPDDFPLAELHFEGDFLLLTSTSGEQLKLTLQQFHQRLRRLGFKFTMKELSTSLRTPSEGKRKKEKPTPPKTVSISGIGRFTYDADVELYEKRKEGVTLFLSGADKEEIRDARKQMAAFWDSRTERIDRVKQYCANELLSLKNESWLSDGEDSVSEEEFVKKLQWQEMEASLDGITLYFSDGDLFWGHDIEVEIDKNGNLISADIVG